jgi:HEAT repeat protein
MMNNTGKKLIDELLSNPEDFNKHEKGYDLLQAFLAGMPSELLFPLLDSNNQLIQEIAVWIISELGIDGCRFLPKAVQLLNSKSRIVKYYALEIISICADDADGKNIILIIKNLDDHDDVIRIHAMNLVSNLNKHQLEFGLKELDAPINIAKIFTVLQEISGANDFHKKSIDLFSHQSGLQAMMKADDIDREEIILMLNNPKPLIQRYGAIIAKKTLKKYPDLINYALSNVNPDVREFARDAIELIPA